ncbi:hypothetical protein H4R18_004520 [Coemansia javaensis]|uniref:Uncharacterized protein n=1 Tax=Coemansia javaensis TaxID=2761396 RepID=A0A9W8H4N5_9FUNG|nr:hypothetical protein H4R18_004520 [Coemansia javaensis]
MTVALPDGTECRYSVSDNVSVMYQFHCSYILLFRNAGGEEHFLTPDLLKRGLDVLVRRFYQPVAGWFETNGDKVDVVFSNARRNDPLFTTQRLDMGYEELAQHVHASNVDLFVPATPRGVIRGDGAPMPMFLARATYLAGNEGVVLGVSYHHALMDGSAFWEFMANWARVCRQLHAQDAGTDASGEPSLPHPPAFGLPDSSHLLDPARQFEHTEYVVVDADKCLWEFKPGADVITERVFTVSTEHQAEIRQMAKDAGVSFTEMLCAVFWKEVNDARLRARPALAAETALFTCAVNPRRQLGVPATQCASPVLNTAAAVTVGALAQLDLRGVARLVSGAIGRCTGAYAASSYAFLRAQLQREAGERRQHGRVAQRVMLTYVRPDPVKCTVSSSRTFPIYQTDFGFGPPEYVRPPFLPFDGCVRIWPTPRYSPAPGAAPAPIEVYASLPEHVDLSAAPLLSRLPVRA